MYWSYLTNISTNSILTFESGTNINKLIEGYCNLIIDDYFIGFIKDYNTLFISEYNPSENPIEKEKKFIIDLTDVNFATHVLNSNMIAIMK